MAQAEPGQGSRDVVESGFSLAIITAGVLAATLMQTLDTTIVNVAFSRSP